jgi:hypothetical protein
MKKSDPDMGQYYHGWSKKFGSVHGTYRGKTKGGKVRLEVEGYPKPLLIDPTYAVCPRGKEDTLIEVRKLLKRGFRSVVTTYVDDRGINDAACNYFMKEGLRKKYGVQFAPISWMDNAPHSLRFRENPTKGNYEKLFEWYHAFMEFMRTDPLLSQAWVGYMEPCGFITNLACPQALALTAMTAIRMPYEHTSRTQHWYELTQQGMNPRLALWVCKTFDKTGKDSARYRGYSAGHDCLSGQRMSKRDVMLFAQGKLPDRKEEYYQKPINRGYQSVNDFWCTGRTGWEGLIKWATAPVRERDFMGKWVTTNKPKDIRNFNQKIAEFLSKERVV